MLNRRFSAIICKVIGFEFYFCCYLNPYAYDRFIYTLNKNGFEVFLSKHFSQRFLLLSYRVNQSDQAIALWQLFFIYMAASLSFASSIIFLLAFCKVSCCINISYCHIFICFMRYYFIYMASTIIFPVHIPD